MCTRAANVQSGDRVAGCVVCGERRVWTAYGGGHVRLKTRQPTSSSTAPPAKPFVHRFLHNPKISFSHRIARRRAILPCRPPCHVPQVSGLSSDPNTACSSRSSQVYPWLASPPHPSVRVPRCRSPSRAILLDIWLAVRAITILPQPACHAWQEPAHEDSVRLETLTKRSIVAYGL